METTAHVEITVHARQDDTPVRGNAMASGDDAADREMENWILTRLLDGDEWAWADVEVRATLYTESVKRLTASTYLGCCTYDNEAAFRADDGYFTDMAKEARALVLQDLAELQAIDINALL